MAHAMFYGTPFYGTPLSADKLAPLNMGRVSGMSISYRFRATHTGDVDNLVIYLRFAQDYYSGNGGSVLIELRSDDGTQLHLPSSDVLSSALIQEPMNDQTGYFVESALAFPVITFSPTVQLVEGEIYHLVFTNPSPDPNNNWVSINNLFIEEPTEARMQPGVSNTDLAVLIKHDSVNYWRVLYQYTPIFSLSYLDGESQGQGYMEVLVGYEKTIAGETHVREYFEVGQKDVKVKSVSVYLKREKSEGELVMRLMQGDEAIIEKGSIPAAEIDNTYDWITFSFDPPAVLQKGKSYSLLFSAANGGQFSLYPIKQGDDVGLSGGLFIDGEAQVSWDSGLTWYHFKPQGGYRADLQFYFEVVIEPPKNFRLRQ
jgi:hypothetical protein